MRATNVITILGCGVLPFSAQAKQTKPVAAQRPNIIFILSDDHSRAAISAYGGINAKLAPTPNIDAIADAGAIFNNVICTNSISGPSRACLITGKYSTTNGFYQNEGGITFDESQPTTPKILQANGYATALFGKWHLYTTPSGFDHFMIHDNPGQQGTYWDPLYNTNGAKAVKKGYATNLTTDAAIEWLEQGRNGDKPFCVMLHYKAPHRPWEPDTKYLDLFGDVEFPYPETFNDDYSGREQTLGQNMATIENHTSRGDMKMPVPPGFDKKHAAKWLWYGGSGAGQYWSPDQTMTKEEVKKWKFQIYLKNYLRCVRSVDDNVGRVIDYLKSNGLYENTIIVYMGDQGFFLGEHGLYDKRWMYEESIQMPCLVSYPAGVKSGTVVDRLATNVDIAPTLLDYAGVRVPKDMHGVSLRPLLEQKNVDKTWRKSVYYQYFEYPKWHRVQPHYGVRTDRYKLIRFYYDVDLWELYDLEKDPNEMVNQYANPAYASTVAELKKELKRLQVQYNDDLPLDKRRELTDRYMIKYEE